MAKSHEIMDKSCDVIAKNSDIIGKTALKNARIDAPMMSNYLGHQSASHCRITVSLRILKISLKHVLIIVIMHTKLFTSIIISNRTMPEFEEVK